MKVCGLCGVRHGGDCHPDNAPACVLCGWEFLDADEVARGCPACTFGVDISDDEQVAA